MNRNPYHNAVKTSSVKSEVLLRLSTTALSLAETYYKNHLSGFPDWKGYLSSSGDRRNQLELLAAENSGNIHIDRLIGSELLLLKKMQRIDSKLINWLVKYGGASRVKGKGSNNGFEKKLKGIIKGNNEKNIQGPIWIINPAYQELLSESAQILNDIMNIHWEISRLVNEEETPTSSGEKHNA